MKLLSLLCLPAFATSPLAESLLDPDDGVPFRSVGDLYGDGVLDLLIGAPGFNAERHDVGRVYLVQGVRLEDGSIEVRIEDGPRAGTYVFDAKLRGPVLLSAGRKG